MLRATSDISTRLQIVTCIHSLDKQPVTKVVASRASLFWSIERSTVWSTVWESKVGVAPAVATDVFGCAHVSRRRLSRNLGCSRPHAPRGRRRRVLRRSQAGQGCRRRRTVYVRYRLRERCRAPRSAPRRRVRKIGARRPSRGVHTRTTLTSPCATQACHQQFVWLERLRCVGARVQLHKAKYM